MLKKTEIIPSIFPDHNRVKLETDSQRKPGNFTNMSELNNTFENNHWVKGEIKNENRKCMETNENENTSLKTTGAVRKRVVAVTAYTHKHVGTLPHTLSSTYT